jgi:hypothetical protein
MIGCGRLSLRGSFRQSQAISGGYRQLLMAGAGAAMLTAPNLLDL